jgi:protein-S-isoprenylcysteine O-methyltransferase Ste14
VNALSTIFAAVRSLVYMSGFFFLWGWLALSVRPLDRSLEVDMPSWVQQVGVGMMIVGGLLALSCVTTFVLRGRGTPAPFDPPRAFVAIGPYRYVRNPMYIGGMLLVAGFGLIERSLAMCLFTTPAAVIAHLFVVLVEEKGLEQRFGETYRAYKRRVKRWASGASSDLSSDRVLLQILVWQL